MSLGSDAIGARPLADTPTTYTDSSQTLTGATIASGSAVYAPTVANSQSLSLPVIGGSVTYSGGVAFNATNKFLKRTTSLIDITQSYTVMAWVRITAHASTSTWHPFFSISNGTVGDEFAHSYQSAAQWVMNGWLEGCSSNPQTVISETPPGSWHHLAWVVSKSGSDYIITPYLDGTAQTAIGPNAGTRPTPTAIMVGAWPNVASPSDVWDASSSGEIAAVKVWQAALTSGEVSTEKDYYAPQKTGCILCWTEPDGTDRTGTANLTPNTTLTSVTGPAGVTEGSVGGGGSAVVYAPSSVTVISNQSLTGATIASGSTTYAPTVDQGGALSITLATIAAGSVISAPSVNQPGSGEGITTVGYMYLDGSPKQVVRTSTGVLYLVGVNCYTYPDLTTNGLDQTVRVFKADSATIPCNSFTRKDSGNEPAAAIVAAVAVDGSDLLHIAWLARSSASLTRYLRYATFNTSTDTWGSVTSIVSNCDFDDIGQGEQGVALVLDANGKVHIAYLSTAGTGTITDRRVYYVHNVSGSWSTPARIDSDITYTGNEKAWHPGLAFDDHGRLIASFIKGQYNDENNGTIYTRTKEDGGSWNSSVSIATGICTGIDNSPSLLVTDGGRYHLVFIGAKSGAYAPARYRYSDDHGASWSSNDPSGLSSSHNVTLGPGGGATIRIWDHTTTDPVQTRYAWGAGGSSAWQTAVQVTNTADAWDCTVNTRWSQYFHYWPGTIDAAFWTAVYSGSGNQTSIYQQGTSVELPLVASTASIFVPTVSVDAQTLTMPTIASASTTAAPTVTPQSVTLSLSTISSGSVVYLATVVPQSVTLSTAFISSGSNVNLPTILPQAVTLSLATISTTGVIFSPSVVPQSVTLSMPGIGSGSATAPPTVTTGGLTLSLPSISTTSDIFAVTVVVGSVSLVLSYLSSSSVVSVPTVIREELLNLATIGSNIVIYEPVVSQGAVIVSLPTISSSVTVYSLTLTTGSVSLSLPSISSSESVSTPTISVGSVSISLPLIPSSLSLYEPVLSQGSVVIAVPFINNSVSVYSPTVSVGAVTVSLPFISSSVNLYTQRLDLNLALSFVNSTESTYTPTVIPQSVSLQLSNIPSGELTYSPSLVNSGAIALPIISSTESIWAVTLSVQGVSLTLAHISNSNSLYSQTITVGAVTVNLAIISSGLVLSVPTVLLTGYVSPPFINSSSNSFTPTVIVQSVSLSLPSISSGITLTAPVLNTSVTLSGVFLNSTLAVNTPTVVPQSVTLTLSSITNSPVIYNPSLDTVVSISLPIISSGISVRIPSLSYGLVGNTIPTNSITYSPTVIPQAVTLTLPRISSDLVLYNPSVAYTVVNSFVSSTSSLYTQTITVGGITLVTPILGSSVVMWSPMAIGGVIPVFIRVEFEDSGPSITFEDNGPSITFTDSGPEITFTVLGD